MDEYDSAFTSAHDRENDPIVNLVRHDQAPKLYDPSINTGRDPTALRALFSGPRVCYHLVAPDCLLEQQA
jgi:hypothetical protein